MIGDYAQDGQYFEDTPADLIQDYQEALSDGQNQN